MDAAWIGGAATLALSGVMAVIMGLVTEAPPPPAVGRRPWTQRVAAAWRGQSRGRQRLIIGALAAGALAYALTQWAPIVIILPLLIILLPLLLADPPTPQIDMLEALDRWVRALAASIPTGKAIPDAIRATRHQAPGPLAVPVTLLAQRLNQRWRVDEALRAFADDADSADVDAVAAALIVASDRGGLGATSTLEALADSIQDRLGAARDIETERAKPRIVVRQVVTIILAVIGVVLITSPGYFQPLTGGWGPLVLIVLVAIFLGSLLKLRLSGLPRRPARILTACVDTVVATGPTGIAEARVTP